MDKQIMSVSIHNDYYVFSISDFSVLISYLFGIVGFGYLMMKIYNKKLIKWLNWMHIIVSISGASILFIVPYLYTENDLVTPNTILILTGLVVIFSQLFYLINIIISIFRKDKSFN
ncbi:hypothetical protein BW723_08160 [Polaribacter reichenbachii]|uniref:Uncharacterized protein n=2 Tax=Polaribacter reichenbachii TaxID=996801 RepID=A0A1B8U710_9FLAO|nr:hypothetical protein BW723_08160 [Polaribacter reichenbachii]AUC20133.1 hypothetical protein BTO17_16180 [Polaribacter reichenbachii]OBY67608.1 hypothetical protein LPB301_01330 [Polaribacter reichenbachii]